MIEVKSVGTFEVKETPVGKIAYRDDERYPLMEDYVAIVSDDEDYALGKFKESIVNYDRFILKLDDETYHMYVTGAIGLRGNHVEVTISDGKTVLYPLDKLVRLCKIVHSMEIFPVRDDLAALVNAKYFVPVHSVAPLVVTGRHGDSRIFGLLSPRG